MNLKFNVGAALIVAPLLIVVGNSRCLGVPPPTASCDYNRDGYCNAADYTIWRNSMAGLNTTLDADGNQSLFIDPGDYTHWKIGYGTSSPGSGALASAAHATTVPEPGGMLLLIVGAIFASPALARQRRLQT
jgi:hypothetical protein